MRIPLIRINSNCIANENYIWPNLHCGSIGGFFQILQISLKLYPRALLYGSKFKSQLNRIRSKFTSIQFLNLESTCAQGRSLIVNKIAYQ